MLCVDRIHCDTDLLNDDGKLIGAKEGYLGIYCQNVDEDDFFNKFLED